MISFILIASNIGKTILYNKFYLNGNSENNIKRSILDFENNPISDLENISIIKKIQLNEDLVVIYKNKLLWGVTEFGKDNWGDYKINFLESMSLGEIHYYMTSSLKNINQYFIVYGDGSNLEFSRVDVGINNNNVSIDIPEGMFVEVINLNQFSNVGIYRFTYKYY